METVSHAGWPNGIRLANEKIELTATTDVGPRVIRFGFLGAENEFWTCRDHLGKSGGEQWRLYGGHRLWHAPEVEPRTYAPDNGPVRAEEIEHGVRLVQSTEKNTGIQKEIELRLRPGENRVQLTHRLRNNGPWGVELAPWAISVMAPGGRAIVPLPPRGAHPEHLAPASSFTLWPYTDLSDPRWTLGRKYVLLKQDAGDEAAARGPQKLGLSVPDGWVAYARSGRLFVKKFAYAAGATYPDFGACVEVFTNQEMLEVETLGPLRRLPPGSSVEHLETWFLFPNVPTPENDEDVERHVLPRIQSTNE